MSHCLSRLFICYAQYWRTHRHPQLLFPALGRSGTGAKEALISMAKSSVQGALRRAKFEAGVRKKGVAIHTLRHSYATHLLQAGVNLRVIQRYMGHAQLETIMLYLHLTQKSHRCHHGLSYGGLRDGALPVRQLR